MSACPPSRRVGYRPFPTSGGSGGGGFTLVEVLLAMVLTAVLLSALMMVSVSSMQDRQRLAERQDRAEPAWLRPVAVQIEADLLMGDGVSGLIPDEGGRGASFCILTRHRTLDAGQRLAEVQGTPHQPVLVAYRLVDSPQGGVLLREQRPLTRPAGVTSTASHGRSVQVVAVGIDRVRIGGVTLDPRERAAPTDRRGIAAFTLLVDNRPVAMQPIPAQTPLSLTPTPSDKDILTPTYQRTLLTQ